MIDLHVHTQRCHHAEGDFEDYINRALELELTTIGFCEHAPFLFDHNKRMNISEVSKYFEKLRMLKKRYANQLNILAGLEVDYMPEAEPYIRQLIDGVSCDYLFAGVHFLKIGSKTLSIWDFEHWQAPLVRQYYFYSLIQAIESGLFDGIVHPDSILRSGLQPSDIKEEFDRLIECLAVAGVSYEVNCSGFRKNAFDQVSGKMQERTSSFPNLEFAIRAHQRGVPITIGSDAHRPRELAMHIPVTLQRLFHHGVDSICSFESRTPVMISLRPPIISR